MVAYSKQEMNNLFLLFHLVKPTFNKGSNTVVVVACAFKPIKAIGLIYYIYIINYIHILLIYLFSYNLKKYKKNGYLYIVILEAVEFIRTQNKFVWVEFECSEKG